jgi:hypothetical protein
MNFCSTHSMEFSMASARILLHCLIHGGFMFLLKEYFVNPAGIRITLCTRKKKRITLCKISNIFTLGDNQHYCSKWSIIIYSVYDHLGRRIAALQETCVDQNQDETDSLPALPQ